MEDLKPFAPAWVIYIVIAILGLQVVTTGSLVIVGAAVIGRYAERLDDTKATVDASASTLLRLEADVDARLTSTEQRQNQLWQLIETNKLRIDKVRQEKGK